MVSMTARPFVPYFAVLLIFAVQVSLNQGLKQMTPVPARPAEDLGRRWNPQLFKTLTFGNLPAAVDWLWMDSLQDESVSHVLPGTHAGAYYTFDLITDLDPLFFDIYPSGANLLAVVRNDAEGALNLLMKGNHFRKRELPAYPADFKDTQWRNCWAIPLVMAYVYLFEQNNMPRAAVAFREAAAISGSPPYLQSLADRLRKPGGEYEAGIRLLNFLIEGASSESLKNELLSRRASLLVGHYLFQLNSSFQEYRGGHPGLGNEKLWAGFLKEARVSGSDPWGGKLQLSPEGRVISTTPHSKVFGLD